MIATLVGATVTLRNGPRIVVDELESTARDDGTVRYRMRSGSQWYDCTQADILDIEIHWRPVEAAL